MTQLHDPASFTLHFFLIPPLREGATLQSLQAFLQDYAERYAAATKRPAPAISLDHARFPISDRLAHIELAGHELTVRTILDAVMLRTRREHLGPFSVQQVARLDFTPAVELPKEEVPNYYGACRLRYAETDDATTPEQRAEIGRELAAALRLTWLDDAEAVHTQIGTLLFAPAPDTPARTLDAIFLTSRTIAKQIPPRVFLLTLPELILSHLKVRNSVDNLHNTVLPDLNERQTWLAGGLPEVAAVGSSPATALALNDQLTTRQATLVDAVARCKAELRTIRINRANFTRAVRESPFRSAATLRHQLIDRYAQLVEAQAAADLGYAAGVLRRAAIHVQSIAASGEYLQARALGKLNCWVIVLAALQVILGGAQVYFAWK